MRQRNRDGCQVRGRVLRLYAQLIRRNCRQTVCDTANICKTCLMHRQQAACVEISCTEQQRPARQLAGVIPAMQVMRN